MAIPSGLNLTNIGLPIGVGVFDQNMINNGVIPPRTMYWNSSDSQLYFRTPEGQHVQVDMGGGGTSTIQRAQIYQHNVNTFSDLPTINNVANDLAFVRTATGTAFQRITGSANYRKKGTYVWTGTEWINDDSAVSDAINALQQELRVGNTLPGLTGNNARDVFVLTAVDGSNQPGIYTWSGTAWTPVVSGGSITVEDETTPLTGAATTLRFTGDGVQASNDTDTARKIINIARRTNQETLDILNTLDGTTGTINADLLPALTVGRVHEFTDDTQTTRADALAEFVTQWNAATTTSTTFFTLNPVDVVFLKFNSGLSDDVQVYIGNQRVVGASSADPLSVADFRDLSQAADTLSRATANGLYFRLDGSNANTTDVSEAAATAIRAALRLDQVDNTSDANKPVSTAQQAAIDAKTAVEINTGDALTSLDLRDGHSIQITRIGATNAFTIDYIGSSQTTHFNGRISAISRDFSATNQAVTGQTVLHDNGFTYDITNVALPSGWLSPTINNVPDDATFGYTIPGNTTAGSYTVAVTVTHTETATGESHTETFNQTVSIIQVTTAFFGAYAQGNDQTPFPAFPTSNAGLSSQNIRANNVVVLPQQTYTTGNDQTFGVVQIPGSGSARLNVTWEEQVDGRFERTSLDADRILNGTPSGFTSYRFAYSGDSLTLRITIS